MNKTLRTVLALAGMAALSAGAHAQSPFYVGAGIVGGSGDFEDSTVAPSFSTSNDTGGGAIKLGYILASGHRIEFSYSSIDLKFPTVTRSVSGFDFDFLWTFDAGALKPYLGVGLGAYVFEDSAQFFVDNKDLSGVALNLSGGLVFEVVKNVELEAALRIKSIESQDVQRGSRVGSWNQTMTNVYLGANLRF